MEKNVSDPYLFVRINDICTHSYREDRDWGHWEETYMNNLESVSLDKDRAYYSESVPVDFEVAKGDIVYVLWAEYSTGDSFGRGVRNATDIVHVFKDENKAWDAYRLLMDVGEKDRSGKFVSDTGKEVPYYCPWLGYFEELDALHVDTAIVE
jgi:hypothetical protein